MNRTVAATVAAAATALMAAGCSSSAGGSPAMKETSGAADTSVAATSSAAAKTSESHPSGGSQTLRFGQTAVAAVTDFTTNKTHQLKVTVSLRQGSLADLKGFDLDAATKRSTPFYLSIQVTNVGTTSVDTSGFGGLLTVDDAAGDQVSSLTLLGTFSQCQGAVPDTLKPDQTGDECDVYTAPEGERVTKVSIDTGSAGATITWS